MSNIVLLISTAFMVAFVLTLSFATREFYNASRPGPRVNKEVLERYKGFAVVSMLRLFGFVFCVLFYLALIGGVTLVWINSGHAALPAYQYVFGELLAILLVSGLLFFQRLINSPGSLCISLRYSIKRFLPAWRIGYMLKLTWLFRAVVVVWAGAGFLALIANIESYPLPLLLLSVALLFGVPGIVFLEQLVGLFATGKRRSSRSGKPNILLIGCDTLRADRLGANGYNRELTPGLDKLCRTGAHFSNCFIPLARTAPSLVSYMSGLLPPRHGVRDNFVGKVDDIQSDSCLPGILRNNGYHTAVISDWAGSDFGKFDFGYEKISVPPDQWNLKFLIRQGTKDLRLFLTLFFDNVLGEKFLPEIFYLAGKPMGRYLLRKSKDVLSGFAQDDKPFFLNVFFSTTHPPFSTEYPYYARYADIDYSGDSKFIMTRLTDPEEIIQSQKELKGDFDLDQIRDLYDASVKAFDDQVADLLSYLEAAGELDNTLVCIYSDHGIDFFERDTWGQGNCIYSDVSYRVPLILSGPGIPASQVEDRVVRSVDVMPTILEIAGISVPENIDGVSLQPYLHDSFTTGGLDLAAYAETGIWLTRPPHMQSDHLIYPDIIDLLTVENDSAGVLSVKAEYRDSVVNAKDRMIRTDRWKLVGIPLQGGVQFQLFDIQQDPLCKSDVADENPDTVAELSARLHELIGQDQILP